MILDGHWKYIQNRFDIDELYDLKTDPGEMKMFQIVLNIRTALHRCSSKSARWFAGQVPALMRGACSHNLTMSELGISHFTI